MAPKFKALVFNYLSFAILFLIFRYGIGYFFGWSGLWAGVFSAIAAAILCLKFGVAKTDKGIKMFMKLPFVKGLKEL